MTQPFKMLRLKRGAGYKHGEELGRARACEASLGDLIECMLPSPQLDWWVADSLVAAPCVFLGLFDGLQGHASIRVACEHGIIELDALRFNRVLSKA